MNVEQIDSHAYLQLTLGLSLLVNLGVAVFAFLQKILGKKEQREIYPQPLSVNLDKEYATKEEVNELRDNIEGRFKAMDDKFEIVRAEQHRQYEHLLKVIDDRGKAHHDRLNLVLTAVSEIKGRCNTIHGLGVGV